MDIYISWGQALAAGAGVCRSLLILVLVPCGSLGQYEEPPRSSNDFMCQCEFKDNNWVYHMNDILKHVQDLPVTLQDHEHPSTKWVLAQTCDEEATVFPNTELILDVKDVIKLRQLAIFPASGGRLEAHHLCLPGQVAMAMVCAQQWLVKRSVMGVIKWVGKMTELLSVVHECMDVDSPLPLRAADFKAYMELFQAGVPSPQSPNFITDRAFPGKAVLKTYEEAAEPLHECLPLKDSSCFARHTPNLFESCTECCHPSKGAKGEVQCWVGPYTYDRCCRRSPRPWPIEVEESQCRAADKLNTQLQSSLDHELRKVRDLGKQVGVLKEDLKVSTEEGEKKTKEILIKEANISSLLEVIDQVRLELKEYRMSDTVARSKAAKIEEQLSACREQGEAKDKHTESIHAKLDRVTEQMQEMQLKEEMREAKLKELEDLKEGHEAKLKELEDLKEGQSVCTSQNEATDEQIQFLQNDAHDLVTKAKALLERVKHVA